MPNLKCTAKGCAVEHKPWRNSNVGDFLEDNPGWCWGIDNNADTFTLCPEHTHEAAELTVKLFKIIGRYGVSPILLRVARELGMLDEYCAQCDGTLEEGYCRACNHPEHLGHI